MQRPVHPPVIWMGKSRCM